MIDVTWSIALVTFIIIKILIIIHRKVIKTKEVINKSIEKVKLNNFKNTNNYKRKFDR